MTFTNIICFLLLCSSIVFMIMEYKHYKLKKELKKHERERTNHITKLFQMLEKIGDERNAFKERVVELENAIEGQYGVSVRREVTVVKADFTKLEMVIMFAGVDKLLKNPKSADDAEFYVKLLKKIQPIIDKMEEPEEEKK